MSFSINQYLADLPTLLDRDFYVDDNASYTLDTFVTDGELVERFDLDPARFSESATGVLRQIDELFPNPNGFRNDLISALEREARSGGLLDDSSRRYNIFDTILRRVIDLAYSNAIVRGDYRDYRGNRSHHGGMARVIVSDIYSGLYKDPEIASLFGLNRPIVKAISTPPRVGHLHSSEYIALDELRSAIPTDDHQDSRDGTEALWFLITNTALYLNWNDRAGDDWTRVIAEIPIEDTSGVGPFKNTQLKLLGLLLHELQQGRSSSNAGQRSEPLKFTIHDLYYIVNGRARRVVRADGAQVAVYPSSVVRSWPHLRSVVEATGQTLLSGSSFGSAPPPESWSAQG